MQTANSITKEEKQKIIDEVDSLITNFKKRLSLQISTSYSYEYIGKDFATPENSILKKSPSITKTDNLNKNSKPDSQTLSQDKSLRNSSPKYVQFKNHQENTIQEFFPQLLNLKFFDSIIPNDSKLDQKCHSSKHHHHTSSLNEN
jgi:hypothetical protein